jgi:hypothetical protein
VVASLELLFAPFFHIHSWRTPSPELYFGWLRDTLALFRTNATAFVLIGIPQKAYYGGIETFGLNASLCALGILLVF